MCGAVDVANSGGVGELRPGGLADEMITSWVHSG